MDRVRAYRRMSTDTECRWETETPETFRYGFGIFLFDVRKAKQIICSVPHEIKMVATPREHVEKLVGRPPVEGEPLRIDLAAISVDWKKAATTDPTIPLIVASAATDPDSYDRQLMVIDGHHRLAKAYLDNIPELPAVFLTDKETDEIMKTTLRLKRRRKK